jgi:hypothetical protein
MPSDGVGIEAFNSSHHSPATSQTFTVQPIAARKATDRKLRGFCLWIRCGDFTTWVLVRFIRCNPKPTLSVPMQDAQVLVSTLRDEHVSVRRRHGVRRSWTGEKLAHWPVLDSLIHIPKGPLQGAENRFFVNRACNGLTGGAPDRTPWNYLAERCWDGRRGCRRGDPSASARAIHNREGSRGFSRSAEQTLLGCWFN